MYSMVADMRHINKEVQKRTDLEKWLIGHLLLFMYFNLGGKFK